MKLESIPTKARSVCPVCRRPVASHHTKISVQGMTFHAYCAGYKRRAGV
jgi:hypothetical protein